MKNFTLPFIFACSLTLLQTFAYGQNVGINCLVPAGKLHIRGSADMPQFILDANSAQSNTNPLIKLRNVDGVDLMWIHSDDSTNIFMGYKNGRVNNVAAGGIKNTFIGKNSGYANTAGNNNTAVGQRALYLNALGYSNNAFGSEALYSNVNGINNLAFGRKALYANTNGDNNMAIGVNALLANVGGFGNIAIGNGSLYNNTGSQNTGIGIDVLYANTTGEKNTAIGYQALFANHAGSKATAVGYLAMANCNQTNVPFDNCNVAVGYEALAGGNPSLTGNFNTGLGFQTLKSTLSGNNNAATGYNSLQANSTGNTNTANGSNALFYNTSGSNNSGFGHKSVYINTTGSGNTGLGEEAFFTTNTLSNTTAVGYYAGGFTDASNRIEIGNTSVNWIGGEVTWSTYSDGRIKNNVEANVPGLDFINRLRPVTYNLNIHHQNEMVYNGKDEMMDWPEKYDIEKMRITGFIAQEVAQAAQETGFDFSGVEIPKNPSDLYSIRYSDFVMPLVKAVQELNVDKNELKSEVEILRSENENLLRRIEKLEELVTGNKG